MFKFGDKSLLFLASVILTALTYGVVWAGQTTIGVKDANSVTRAYDVITDSSGNYVGMFAVCDGTAAAQCAAVKPSNTAPATTDPALVVGAADGNIVTLGVKSDTAYGGSGSASVVSVLKGIYTAITGPIAAGTNTIGSVSSVLSTSGGWTPLIANALTNSALPIKGSAGQLGMLQCYNPNQAQSYIQIFNVAAASVTLGVTLPTLSIPLAPTATGGMALSNPGIQFSTAISIAATTTATGSTAPATAVDCNTVFH